MEYNIGDIRSGCELGYKSNIKYIWVACESCGKERWVQYANGKAVKSECGSCAQRKASRKSRLPSPASLRIKATGIKKCGKCGNTYPATEEYFQGGKKCLSVQSPCKKCRSETSRLHRISTGRQLYDDYKAYNSYVLQHHPHRTMSLAESKLHTCMRTAICTALKGNKNGRAWESIVGYTTKQLKKHLEKQFIDGMSWGNHGKCNKGNTTWHIDHIIPKSAFNITSVDDFDFKRCWALSNLRPMWGVDNCRKSKSVLYPFQISL